MKKREDKKLKVVFEPTRDADNELENNAILIQLMVTVATVGLRVDKYKDCSNIMEVNNHEENTEE